MTLLKRSLLLALLPTVALAEPRDLSLRAGVFSESLALPWTQRFDAPLHPGATLGVEFTLVGSRTHRLLQGFSVAYAHVAHVQHAVELSAEWGYRYTAPFGLQLEAALAVGYLHELLDGVTYASGADGSWKPVTDLGRPQLWAAVALGVGLDLRRIASAPMDVFVRYQPGLQLPYSVANGIPVLPHVSLMVGVRYHFDGSGS
jgi:hypothetical protein